MTALRIAHVALWTTDLERLSTFYADVFGIVAGERYESTRQPGFVSRFLTFPGGTAIELMQAPWLKDTAAAETHAGYAHIAIGLGSAEAVDALAETARQGGFLQSPPRHTGDGFYEAILLDPDSNPVEITI